MHDVLKPKLDVVEELVTKGVLPPWSVQKGNSMKSKFTANTLKAVYKEDILANKHSYQRLKSLVKQAHKNV